MIDNTRKNLVINFTEEDLQDLMTGKEFSWAFPLRLNGGETLEWVDVEITNDRN